MLSVWGRFGHVLDGTGTLSRDSKRKTVCPYLKIELNQVVGKMSREKQRILEFLLHYSTSYNYISKILKMTYLKPLMRIQVGANSASKFH